VHPTTIEKTNSVISASAAFIPTFAQTVEIYCGGTRTDCGLRATAQLFVTSAAKLWAVRLAYG
jgi:hypothetical protein